jgi:quercetin 2,3-dioxygenase
MPVIICRTEDRYFSSAAGRRTQHSFSFGPHYDAANISFGGMVAHHEDQISPGHGYPEHPHRDLEIVTWVLSGALSHRDSSGKTEVVRPGQIQAQSTGSGIMHSEMVATDALPTRLIQTWVRPRSPGGTPKYWIADAHPQPDELTPLASGVRQDALVPIGANATLYLVHLTDGIRLPDARLIHVFVAAGSVELEGQLLGTRMGEGDAAKLSDVGALSMRGRGELLVWSF